MRSAFFDGVLVTLNVIGLISIPFTTAGARLTILPQNTEKRVVWHD